MIKNIIVLFLLGFYTSIAQHFEHGLEHEKPHSLSLKTFHKDSISFSILDTIENNHTYLAEVEFEQYDKTLSILSNHGAYWHIYDISEQFLADYRDLEINLMDFTGNDKQELIIRYTHFYGKGGRLSAYNGENKYVCIVDLQSWKVLLNFEYSFCYVSWTNEVIKINDTTDSYETILDVMEGHELMVELNEREITITPVHSSCGDNISIEDKKELGLEEIKDSTPVTYTWVNDHFIPKESKVQNPEYDKMLQDLLPHKVPEVTVTQIARNSSPVIYLDARERNEYEVSHLKDAIWVGYKDFKASRLKDLDSNARIVVYCSVGYRSEMIAQKLQKMGYTNVSNLYGGIFEWVNQQKELYNNKELPTQKVHPYDEEWGRWLKHGERVY